MKSYIIEACTDLGTHVDGSHLGPDKIIENLNYNHISKIVKDDIEKSHNPEDKNKNIEAINKFNEELYNCEKSVIEKEFFPITLGGDHSLAIGSALASIKQNKNLGIIWIDSHGDFNTPETTITGNIHGYPFAAICGFGNKDIVKFHDGEFFNPKNAVLVGGRDIDIPGEVNNLKSAGVTVFTTEDILKQGASKIMEEAFRIASNGTNGIHISYDIDSIDPNVAPGVSIPAKNGFGEKEAYEILDSIVDHSSLVKSMDIVEFNPLFDKDDKTLTIARNILNKIVETKENEQS